MDDPATDADPDRREIVQPACQFSKFKGCGRSSGRVVLVGDRRAERRIQIAALVAHRYLQQEAFVTVDDVLCVSGKFVQFSAGIIIFVVVDAGELKKHSHRRPQFGQKRFRALLKMIIDRRQQPGTGNLIVNLEGDRRRGHVAARGQSCNVAESFPAIETPGGNCQA